MDVILHELQLLTKYYQKVDKLPYLPFKKKIEIFY